MPHAIDRRSIPVRYGLALLPVLAAILITEASQLFGLSNRSAAFLAAILLTGWYLGTGPMLFAMVVSTFSFDYFFLPPLHTLGVQPGPDPYLIWFLFFAVLAAWFSTARRRSDRLLEAAREGLEERVSARTAQLERSEAYLVAAQEMSHTGNWSRRMRTGEGTWSSETFRIFGLDPASPAPNRQQLLELIHPEDRNLMDQAFEAAVDQQRPFELDLRITRPNGTIRHVHTKGQPIVDSAGTVVEVMGVIMDVTQRKRAERALRRARERTIETRFGAILEERTRLAREIHDTLLQGFTGVSLQLLAVANRTTGQPETVSQLREVLTLAQRTLEDARRAVWDMRSPSLAGDDVSAALRSAAEASTHGTGLTLEFEAKGIPRPLDPAVTTVVFRVVQEAIANAVKHAKAETIRVRCIYGANRIRLYIDDDGAGFTVDPQFRTYGGHWGLLGMQERAHQIGARIRVRSAPGEGTQVALQAPYAVRGSSAPSEP